MKSFRFHLSDWAAAVHGMTALEEGMYLRLMRWHFLHERPLPPDMGAICKIAGCTNQSERRAVARVVNLAFVADVGGWRVR